MRVAAMLMLLSMTCAKAPTPPPAATQNAQAGARVLFPDGFVVRVEIAADGENRAQGLMYRDHLEPGAGMLFFFPEVGEYPFWMKNTRIPLDMIWIDAQKRIAHIAHNVPPCQIEDCPSYPPNAQALYVLEVAAGVAKQHALKDGDLLRFEQTEDVVVR